MPQAVRSQHRPTLAAENIDADLLEQRASKTLRHCLGPHYDVAAPRGRRKTHRRHGNFPRPGHAFHALQFLPSVLGPRGIAVRIPANELLGLFDFRLLFLERSALDQQTLVLLAAIGRKIARVRVDRAVEQFEGAVGHPIEKIAVVADDNHRRRAFQQKALQPLGRLDVQVIARLVEYHHVWLGQQQLGQHETILLAAAERRDRLLV